MSSAQVEAIRAAGGERMHGPSALTGDWRRTVHLTWTLGYLEFRLRFFGSALGYLWQLFRPLMMFGVYYVIFTVILSIGDGVQNYAPNLLFSIMLYQFFGESTGAAVSSVVDRENLVRKIHFPRIVIPLSVVVTASLTLVLNMAAVGIYMALQRVPVSFHWLTALPAFVMLFVFVIGLAMLLSALYVRYRDVQPIWDVVLQASFYSAPILYPLERVNPEWAQQLIMMNPLAVVIQQVRHGIFDPGAPNAIEAAGGVGWLMIPVGLTVFCFVQGFRVFNRTAPEVAENV